MRTVGYVAAFALLMSVLTMRARCETPDPPPLLVSARVAVPDPPPVVRPAVAVRPVAPVYPAAAPGVAVPQRPFAPPPGPQPGGITADTIVRLAPPVSTGSPVTTRTAPTPIFVGGAVRLGNTGSGCLSG